MKYTVPKGMPSRSVFLTEFLDAIFPDLDVTKLKKGPYAYTAACADASEELGIPYRDEIELGEAVDVNSNIFRLMYELNVVSKEVFNKESPFITEEEYKHYTGTLFSFCSQTNGSIKGWLKQTSDSNRINKSFDCALFFSYLLLSRDACKESRIDFFEKCLSYVGISDIERPVSNKLFGFDWDELGKKGIIGGKEFTRLNNRALILFSSTVLAIMEMIGTYSVDRDGDKIARLHSMFETLFENECNVSKMFDVAEQALLSSNKFFEPRSIQTAKKLYPQDFFVLPRFYHNDEDVDSPITEIKNAQKSKRVLVMAKTGLGKSAFLQIATLCVLKKHYEMDAGNQEKLDAFASKLDIPTDMFVISVPARMFSFCYKDERYKEWTSDFVSLFFNSMWKLSAGFNFYSTQNSQRFSDHIKASNTNNDFSVTEELTDYIYELAREGKLLLVLDSFDEISSGEMRNAYLKALAAFYDKYCCFMESGETGAHVIVSSREMSPSTMRSLEHALELDHNSEIFGIKPLCQEQRRELVYKWNRFANINDDDSAEILEQIERNHYYLDYSINPYMLSVVCFYFGHDLGSITQRFITYLIDRMLKNNRTADPVIQDVLMNISKILQDIAGETITSDNPHFSRQKLDRYLTKLIDKTELQDSDVEQYIDRLHEIFVTEVGLIVPADGDDSDYQFINNQIRFELAAKGIQRALENDERAIIYRDVIFPSIDKLDEYVGLLVPLLCDINLENVQLAELLVSDLALYDFKEESQNKLLVRTMMDLILNRYGGNILTAANPGDKDAKYVRRAQRTTLIRLFTSSAFEPTEEEKVEIKKSPAYKSNSSWLSEKITSFYL